VRRPERGQVPERFVAPVGGRERLRKMQTQGRALTVVAQRVAEGGDRVGCRPVLERALSARRPFRRKA
jgi:hypothetical protein